MKKACLILAVMLWIGMIPAPARAAGLCIDDQHVYEGMDRTYRDGYVPRVQDNTMTIVLPLLAEGDMGDTVTAAPDLGDPAASPFVFRNYQTTAHRARYDFDGAKANAYLIRFDLLLSPDRVNGVYPVTVDVHGKDEDGGEVTQSYTSYVTIADGKKAGSTEQATQPRVIVSDYSIAPSPVAAGEAFTARITLANTSGTEPVANMAVTVSCDSPGFALHNDSNAIFVGGLGSGKSTDIELSYTVDQDTPAQRYTISLAIEYENSEGTGFSSAGTVPVPVSQPLRVEMDMPEIAEEAYAGDTMPLTFQVMNLGRGTVYNVRCEVLGAGLFPSGTAFIGNMEAGTAMSGDMEVFIGTRDMTKGYEGKEKYGLTGGKITLLYEDAYGRQYSEETEFKLTINQPVIQGDTSEEEPARAGQWWVSILIGGALIAGLIVYITLRGKRARINEDI